MLRSAMTIRSKAWSAVPGGLDFTVEASDMRGKVADEGYDIGTYGRAGW
jgi:hypothetical protein